MFSSHKKTTTTGTQSSSGGFLNRLRSSNPNSTAKKPVYTSGTHRTSVTKKPRKTVATGGLTSTHKTKPTLGQKVHGAATVMSGKMHNNHQEVRAGEKEMQGKPVTSGFLNQGSTRHHGGHHGGRHGAI